MIMANKKINVERTCPCCGKKTYLTVNEDDFNEYYSGRGLIQNIFPYLNATERETLKLGYCKECQIDIFGR